MRGIEAPAEILVDRWGVAHISAQQPYDLYFAQGFNAARDRLWQLDLWRRRAEGRLAEVFGPSFVDKDRAARLFLFRGSMTDEWAAYGPDTQRIAAAFTSGINAYIELTEQRDALLPPEFELLDYRPARWEPETIARARSHVLAQNASTEVGRAGVLCAFGATALSPWDRLEPAQELQIPEGLDPCSIPPGVMHDYELARSPVGFPRDLRRKLGMAGSAQWLRARSGAGSNAWAIAGSRTATERPLLSSDPHRALAVPALRYVVHLTAPGLDAIGAGEPALPGISLGHNGAIGFGLTIFGIDQEDVYVYETRPQRPNEYRYLEGWEAMTVIEESLAVRGQASRRITLKLSRHGPIIHENPAARRAFAVRVAWLEPGGAPYLGGLALMRARSWEQFRTALKHWGTPAENVIYADSSGNIGWKPGGLAPVRPTWDGLLPVPGDGRHEWAGFVPSEELPEEVNPDRGWIASANEMNLPAGYPHRLGFEWMSPFRYQRISEVLARAGKVTVGDAEELQRDTVSVPARRLQRLLAKLEPARTETRRAIELLLRWDGALAAESPAAALFEVWYRRHLGPTLVGRLVDEPRLRLVLGGAEPQLRLALLEQPDERFGANPTATRDRILIDSLEAAVRDTTRLLGSDRTSWKWGKIHRAHLRHPLSALLEHPSAGQWDMSATARAGSDDTVCNAGYLATDFHQQLGASFRMVLDVGAWDRSVAINSPGQSGDPRSRHYRDLFATWNAGGSFPLLYTRQAVLAAREQRIVLEPEPGTDP